MPLETNTAPTTEFEFTLEEQWAIYQAFFDHIEVAIRDETELPKPVIELAILEKIENGEFAFTSFELDRLRYECDFHAESAYTPEIDREPARSVVEKIDSRCRAQRGR